MIERQIIKEGRCKDKGKQHSTTSDITVNKQWQLISITLVGKKLIFALEMVISL